MNLTEIQLPFNISQDTVSDLCHGGRPPSGLTIGGLLRLYAALPRMNSTTRRAGERKLLRVVREAISEIQDLGSRGPIMQDQGAVIAIRELPAEILTGRLLEHARRTFESEAEAMSKSGTMSKTLVDHFSGLRDIFTEAFQWRLRREHHFIVPESLYDLRIQRTYEAYVPPHPAVVRHLHAALWAKWREASDFNLCLMIMLGLWAGLRPAESLHARNFLETGGDEPCLRVMATADRIPKCGKGRYVPIPVWLCELIRRHCTGEFLIQGDEPERLGGVAARVQAFLRGCGLTSPQPKHEMRKLYACAAAAKDNDPEKLSERMGHADPLCTWRFYIGHGFIDPTLHLLWDQPFAA